MAGDSTARSGPIQQSGGDDFPKPVTSSYANAGTLLANQEISPRRFGTPEELEQGSFKTFI